MSLVPRRSAAEQDNNTAVDEALARAVEETHLGDVLAAKGLTTVALDEEGRMVMYRRDGSTTVLG